MTTGAVDGRVQRLSADLIAFLETGAPPEGLFAHDVFFDVAVPHWRVQAEGRDEAVALRLQQHPAPGRVVRSRLDETTSGFVLEFEERWHERGHDWYAREIARADVGDDGITKLSVYCTGDWDEAREEQHRKAVRLLRP
ncbi:MAG TPA: hypothetical protein VFI37_02915 [Gaiellaceae bacterium]|nr:hypothetical protein [Gaiellaceae bacterium]